MASPVWQTPAATTTNSTAGTTITISKPTGVVQGDTMVAFLTLSGNNTISTVPSGWILIRRANNGTSVTHATYWKVAGASEGTSYQWGWSSSVRNAGSIHRITGAHGTTPVQGSAVPATGSSNTPDPPSHTPGSTQDYLILTSFGQAAKNNSSTPPTNYTERTDLSTSGGGPNNQHAASSVATRALTTGAAEDPGAFASATSEAWVAQTIFIQPGASPQTIVVNEPTESESAQTVTPLPGGVTRAVNEPTESESAQAVGVLASTSVAVGAATESEAAQPVSFVAGVTSIAVGSVSESESAQTVTPVSVAIAELQLSGFRIDIEYTATASQAIAVTAATESESAQSVTAVIDQTIAVTAATESEAAQAVTPQAGAVSIAAGAATESEAAQTVTAAAGAVTSAVGAASETESAEPVAFAVGAVSIAVTAAIESEAAQAVAPLAGLVSIAVGVATETETAEAVSFVVGATSIAVDAAIETESAQPVSVAAVTSILVDAARYLSRSEVRLEASRYSGVGDWQDRSGNGHHAQFPGGSNDPLFLPVFTNTDRWLRVEPGTASYVGATDPTLDIADDQEFFVRVDADEWDRDGPVAIVGKLNIANQAGFALTTHLGQFLFYWRDGSTLNNLNLGSIPALSGKTWIRVTFDVDNGASQAEGQLYHSSDDTDDPDLVSWTGLGVKTRAVTSIAASTQSLNLGSDPDGSFDGHGGKYYRFVMLDGLGGARVADLYGHDFVEGAGHNETAVDEAGITWTLNNAVANRIIEQYAYFPDATGNYGQISYNWQTADSGSIEYIARVFHETWSPTGDQDVIIGGDNTFHQFGVDVGGNLLVVLHDGSPQSASSVVVPFSPREVGWIRAVIDLDNNTVDFYTSTDDTNDPDLVSWSQLGTQQSLTSGTLSADTTFNIGSGNQVGSLYAWSGGIYRVRILEDAVTQVDVDFSDATEPFASFTEGTGKTVTLNRSASGRVLSIVDRPMFLLGDDDYFEITDDAALDPGTTDITVLLAMRRSIPASRIFQRYATHQDAAGNRWALLGSDDSPDYDALSFEFGPAGDVGGANAADLLVDGVATVIGGRAVFGGGSTLIHLLQDGVEQDEFIAAGEDSVVVNENLVIGGLHPNVASAFADMEVHGFAFWREALTDLEVLRAGLELSGSYGPEYEEAGIVTPVPGAVSVPVVAAVESEEARAVSVTGTQTIVVTAVTESESAETVTASAGAISVAVGAASESESAQTVTAVAGARLVIVTAAIEAESAETVTPTTGAVSIAVTTAVEIELGRPVSADTDANVVFAVESESAGTVAPVGGPVSIAVTAVTESETAQTVSPVAGGAPQSTSVVAAVESESAQVVTAVAGTVSVSVVAAVESEIANPIEIDTEGNLIGAVESESAQTVTPVAGVVSVAVGAVTESELARPISVDTEGNVVFATESETAQAVTPLSGAVSIAVGAVTESETAQAVDPVIGSAPQSEAVVAAGETEAAGTVTPVGGPVSVPVTVAVETEAAGTVDPVLGGAPQSQNVVAAVESEAAQGVTAAAGAVGVSVGVVTESEQAQGVGVLVGAAAIAVAFATESEAANPITVAAVFSAAVTAAVETENAVATGFAVGATNITVGTAVETELARVVAGVGGFIRYMKVTSSDSSQAVVSSVERFGTIVSNVENPDASSEVELELIDG